MRLQWRPHTQQGTVIFNFSFCVYSPIYFGFTRIHCVLALRSVCSLHCVVTYPISLKILRSTRVLGCFDTGFRFGLFPFYAISNVDRSDAVGYVRPSFQI